jgi:cyclopropane fatty-acyl-phospholipid synthase-like methyltransferase
MSTAVAVEAMHRQAAAVRMAAENATLKKGAEVLDMAPGCT